MRSSAIHELGVLPTAVVAYLPLELLRSLRRALGPSANVRWVHTVAALRECVKECPETVIVMDPRSIAPGEAGQLRGLLDRNASARLVVYTALSSRGMAGYSGIIRSGVTALLLRGVDDSVLTLRTVVLTKPVESGATGLLRLIEPGLSVLPSDLAHAISAAFLRDRMVSVVQLAQSARMSSRTVRFLLARAGLPPAETLLGVARVMRACYYLRASDTPITRLASFLGYRTARGITREVRRMTGYRPRDIRRAAQVLPITALLSQHLTARTESVPLHSASAR